MLTPVTLLSVVLSPVMIFLGGTMLLMLLAHLNIIGSDV